MNPEKDKYRANSLLSFPHIYILEASAGSGKTRKLAERYVDFLLRYSSKTFVPFNFRNVLAVTFTNEAAGQMRQEILGMLKTKALGKGPDSLAALRIVEEIIRNFSDFSVRTIDSFVHSLLIASSLELKLPADYEIMSQTQPHLEYVLDSFLDEAVYDQDISGLFSGFLNYFLIIEGQKHWNPKKTLLSLLVRLYREENSHAKLFRDREFSDNLGQMEKGLKSEIAQFLSLISVNSDCNQRIVKGFGSLADSSGLDLLKSLSRYMDKSLSPGAGILNKGAVLPEAHLVRRWAGLKGRYNNYASAFAWLRYSFYLKILGRFRQRMEDYKENKRIVFLGELNKKVKQFLTSEGGLVPAEIYYKLSAVFYHYLIDEFQDTSILQWENIQALVEDALSKGGSLFYVGDKKQAIYRFRGGEVELFDVIKTRFKNRVDRVYDEALLCNFRSRAVIVEFNNSVFSRENLRDSLDAFAGLNANFKERILDVFKNSRQQVRQGYEGGYVRLELLKGENKQEAEECLKIKLKETILQLKERFNYQDILILVRDNQEAGKISGFLLEEDFPVSAARTISIRQNFLIRQLIALLRFLNSPIDNLSFSSFILGQAFSKAVQSSTVDVQSWMEALRVNQVAADEITQPRSPKGERTSILYTLFRSAFPDLWQEFFQYLFNVAGFLPVYDLVTVILVRFKIEENFPHLCGFIRRLLEILNELEEQGKNSLSEFLEWFENARQEDLFVRLPPGLDAIKVLTIHKAKGLAACVVILPFAALEVKVGEVPFESPKIVYERPEGLYLLYPQKDICRSHSELAPIYQEEYFHALLDELNCLYVGFTRAACELYIFLPRKINRGNNALVPLLFDKQKDVRELGDKMTFPCAPVCSQRSSGQRKKGIPLSRGAFKDILKTQLILPEQIIFPGRRQLVNRGEVLHYLLAEIEPFAFLDKPPSYIAMIKDTCRLFKYSNPGEISQCLCDFFRDSRMQAFFNREFKVFKEKEVVDHFGNLKRIDRLVFTGDKIMVIDYKTGEEYQQKHQEQVKQYACLIKEIYPDRLCQGWLIYIDSRQARQVDL